MELRFSNMRLKTRLLLATSLSVLLILALAEWASYHHTAAFLKEHTAFMEKGGSHGIQDAVWQNERRTLLSKLAVLHLFHAGVTLLALILVLNILWQRFFLSPLRELLSGINSMSRGNWARAITTQRADEMGELTRAFNRLGLQITFTAQQFAAASKLSAMALVGQSIMKKLLVATEQLHAITSMLQVASEGKQNVPEPALHNLRAVSRTLEEIRAQFDVEFDRQLQLHSKGPHPPGAAMAENPDPCGNLTMPANEA